MGESEDQDEVEAPALVPVAGLQGAVRVEKVQRTVDISARSGARRGAPGRVQAAVQLTEEEAIIIVSMPQELQQTETLFLLEQDSVTREFWVSQDPRSRNEAATRRHGNMTRGRASTKDSGARRVELGEEEVLVPGGMQSQDDPALGAPPPGHIPINHLQEGLPSWEEAHNSFPPSDTSRRQRGRSGRGY